MPKTEAVTKKTAAAKTKTAKPAAKTKPAAKGVKKPAAKAKTVKTAKPAVKAVKPKTAPAKGNAGLIAELNGLIPQLDEEGILFLIEQAQTHIYNMHVDEVNKFMITTEDSDLRRTSGDFSLKVSKSRYYLSYKNESIMFDQAEMVQIAKFAMSPVPMEERKAALFRWLEEERRDIFGILPAPSSQADIMEDFINMINRTLALKYR